MRKIIWFGIVFLVLSFSVLSADYSPPSYNSFTLILPGSYSTQSYNQFTLILNEITTDTCTCPVSPANYIVQASDNCVLNSVCNITGYTLTINGTGSYTVNNTLYAQRIDIDSGVIVWMKSIGRLFIG